MANDIYTVRPGNTLYAIAQFFGTTVDELQNLNGIQNPDSIYVGQILQIPEFSATGMPQYYVVRPGDSLWTIANRYGLDLDTILRYNQLNDPNVLYPGQILRLSMN